MTKEEAADRLIVCALAFDACMSEFDGNFQYCSEVLDALWDACAAYRKARDAATKTLILAGEPWPFGGARPTKSEP